MSDELKLSVVVPIYNASKYLEKCINSILKQTYKYFELILVDDGSTDDSLLICKQFQKKDNRIQVISTKNSGIFNARKMGGKVSKGEYITFVDADDWIEEEAFEYVIQMLNRELNIDMLSLAYKYNENEKIEKHQVGEGIYSKDEINHIIKNGMIFDHSIGDRRLHPALWSKYIKRHIYLDIVDSIDSYITLGEDALVTYSVMFNANKIAISNKGFYHYCINDNSCTRLFPLERINQIGLFKKELVCQAEKYGYLSSVNDQIEGYTRTFLMMLTKNWFDLELSSVSYLFPLKDLKQNSNIAIYGAGAVGRSFVKQILFSNGFTIVSWMDQKYKDMSSYMGIKIQSPDSLKNIDYDYVIVAVMDEKIALQIINDLRRIDNRNKNIIWKRPVFVG